MRTRSHSGGIGMPARGMLAVVAALLFAAAGCGGAASGPDEKTPDEGPEKPAPEPAADEDLPGHPIPDGPGRIKEGIHLRPGVEFATFSEEESEKYVSFGENMNFAYVRGPARQKLEGFGRRDVLMGHQFLYLVGSEPIETDRGLKVDIRTFHLLDIVWGDFELDFRFTPETLRRSRKEAKPPYRQKSQPLNFPGLRLPLAGFSAMNGYVTGSGNLNVGGDIDFNFSPGVSTTFDARIPFVTPGYECDPPPDYEIKAGCAFGGCMVDEDFCVERVRVETTIETGVQTTLNASASARVQATLPDSGVHIIDRIYGPGVPIPSTPLMIRPDLYLGGQIVARINGVLQGINWSMSESVEMVFGVEYTDDDGVNFFENINRNQNQGDTSGFQWTGSKVELLLRLKAELGLMWNLTPAATGNLRGIEFRLEAFRTAAEARLDNIYTFSPVDDANSPVDGSCLRSRLFVGPYVEPEMDIEAGLDYGIVDESVEISLLPGAGLWWRPFVMNWWNAHDGGQYCLEDRQSELEIPTATEETGQGSQGARPFKIEASWRPSTDVDLHVVTPNGTQLGPSNETGEGGKYVLDTCGGSIPCAGPGRTNSESVLFYPASSAPTGDYTVWVTNDDGRSPAKVQLRARKGDHTYDMQNVQLGGSSGASSPRITLTK